MNDERLKNPKPFGEDYFDKKSEKNVDIAKNYLNGNEMQELNRVITWTLRKNRQRHTLKNNMSFIRTEKE